MEDYEMLSREQDYWIELELEAARQFFKDGESEFFESSAAEQPQLQPDGDSADGRQSGQAICPTGEDTPP